MSTNVEEEKEEHKTSFAKPKADLSKIPEELWLDIFQFASGISRQSAGLGDAPKLLSFPVLPLPKPSHKRKVCEPHTYWKKISYNHLLLGFPGTFHFSL